IEYGRETIVLNQADLKKIIQLDIKSKTYSIVLLDAAPKPAAAPPKQGGVVTMTTNIVDTGERKQVLGHEARHLRTIVDKQPGPGACDAKAERIETDGWYIDLEIPIASATAACPSPACIDEIQHTYTCVDKLG